MIKEGQEKFLRKVAKESFKNAEQFVNDAEILFGKKSYGHAFALGVLGDEELAKAILYSIAAEGIIGIKGKWRKTLRKHARKQIIAFIMALMYELILILKEAADFAKKKSKGNDRKFKQIFEKRAVEILQEEEKMVTQGRGEVFTHLEPFGELQREREKAMYVDANLKALKISSPKRIKRSTAKRYISYVRERLEILKHEIGGKMSVSDKKMACSIIKMMLSKSEGKRKKELLEWYGITDKELEV